MTNAVLIVAAGRGVRFGAPLPKQYLALGEMPVLRRTIRAFLDHSDIDLIQVVIAESDRDLYRMAVSGLALPEPAIGGETRQQSVLNGLEALQVHAPDNVLIHDAARPFVSEAEIVAVLAALTTSDGALPVLPLVDSIKTIDDEAVTGEVDRATLGRALTPQGFRFAAILQAHQQVAGRNLTDDAAVARLVGMSVTAVPGQERNFKITTQHDLQRAEQYLGVDGADTVLEYRTGSGFDVHRFAVDRPLFLCGVKIPHHLGLAGHSDADVGLHALTDAILGAIADGDIGDHFPPTDPRWKDVSSDVFLRHAGQRVAALQGRITALDVTLICEAPKVKPHRQAMREAIARILSIDPARVSVKATTTERLGFAGRGEGIAAQAVATVALPWDVQGPLT